MDGFNKLNIKDWISKPIFGREGLGVFFSSNFTKKTPGNYHKGFDEFVRITENNFGRLGTQKLGKSIYQAEAKLPTAQKRIIQTSAWVVGGMPAALIFREGRQGKHFEDSNPFLLHTVRGKSAQNFEFKMSAAQKAIRDKLYKNKASANKIYKKFGGTPTFKQDSSLPKPQFDGWKSWDSYKRAKLQADSYASLDVKCDINCQSDVRSNIIGRSNGLTNAMAIAFVRKTGQSYRAMPTTKFGYIGKMDMRGYWFSVDRYGVVRMHHFSSAGFARS